MIYNYLKITSMFDHHCKCTSPHNAFAKNPLRDNFIQIHTNLRVSISNWNTHSHTFILLNICHKFLS